MPYHASLVSLAESTSVADMFHFYLNEEEVQTTESSGTLVLDYLRQRAKLMGTKEGCREGDCGACAVLVGELEGERVVYKPVTSCLMPFGEVHGKHLVTVEGMNGEALSPVQQAIVDEGATQCGFCTPGIVVSLMGYIMEDGAEITSDGVKTALSGHLCRCTGYRSLKHVEPHLAESIGEETGLDALVANGALPAYFLDIPAHLRAIAPLGSRNGEASTDVLIAGGTDIYVQQGDALPEAQVHVLNLHPEMKGIFRQADCLRVGALTTFEEFARHPEVVRLVPEIQDYMFLIASWQIRNRATLGGNIINASPIGDMTILLLALEARLVLKDGQTSRVVPMTRFFLGYKQLDKSPSEILTEILIPEPNAGTKVGWEKVSKRKCLDIATVNSAIKVRCQDGIIQEIGLAMGGIAPVPLYMKETATFFTGRRVSVETIQEAFTIAQREASPISDVRGSAEYKRLLVRQLLMAHFVRLFPESVQAREFYEAY